MTNRKRIFWLVFFFILIGPMVAVRNVTKASSTTWVKVVPALASAEPGQNFKVNITIVDVIDLYGWQFYLEWNATLLNYVNVTEGPFLKENTPSPLGTQFVYQIEQDNVGTDYIFPGCTTLGTYAGVGGSGVLATVEFSVEEHGDTSLHLYYVKLRDSARRTIKPSTGEPDYYFTNLVDGRFVNVGVPVASFTFTPPIPLINEEIEFNASASYDTTEGGNITRYFWDFGDLTNATETDPIANHTYTKAGAFTVSLTVYDNDNLTNTATAQIRIRYQHDVAVLEILPHSSTATVGESLVIDVVVSNEGLAPETFTVTLYFDNTTIGSAQNVVNLASLQNKTLSFTWDTSDVDLGIYRIKAVASTVEDEVSDAQVNNTKIGGTVEILESSALPLEMIIAAVGVAVVVIAGGAFFFLRRRRAS